MKIIEELNNLPDHSRIAIIIRHADRDRIPPKQYGNDVLLNEVEKQNSLLFGERIKHKQIKKIYSSPIQRCIQTGEYITKGYGQKLEIITTKSLGDPGLHIMDETSAGEFYLEHGFHVMLERFVKGEETPGVPTPAAFKKGMDEFISKNTAKKGITVFITHDSLIAFYDFCLTGKIYTQENWVNYLSGIIITLE
jgi:broad specificity phosphatase PhoE